MQRSLTFVLVLPNNGGIITKNCIFIDEAGFHTNLRNNWARSTIGTPAKVEIPKIKAPFHTIIGAIHSSSVIHVVMKKPSPKKEKQNKKKRQLHRKRRRSAKENNVLQTSSS